MTSKLKNIENINEVFKDEDGFTTLSVVVSLLLTLSLIFSTAQVYRILSASADIQNVCDSCSQSAENQVAEFMILVRVSDSVVLSLSLGAIVCSALGVVAMCTPVTAEASEVLMDCAQKMFEARDKFAEKTCNALNSMQRALPFLATVKAYELAVSNNGGTFDANYLSIALLMPNQGIEISPGNIENAKAVFNEANNKSSELKEAAKEAEEAAKKANESKLAAFMADCGNNPNYCMYERAKNKAYMTGADNPLFQSPDTWSFSVPLKRCQAYYPKRYEIDTPEGSSVEAQSDSALRKVFYNYANEQFKNTYVIDTGDTFFANFPHLPKNTDEMKSTTMYTDKIFPVSSNCMHAYSGCPGCGSVDYLGSVSQIESENLQECQYCKFNASSLGKVAQASSAIDNGYEYHYAIVEKSAHDYQEAKEKAAPLNSKVKGMAQDLFSKLKDCIKEIANKRIYAMPPGSFGTICLTVNTSSAPASKGFESSFVSGNSSLGIRAAISASTLIEEYSDQGKTILNSVLDGLRSDLPSLAGVGGLALNAWSGLLSAYSNGQESFINSIESALNQLPLISASGLGTWAAKCLSEMFSTVGLEPANLQALKPVLINSFYVANETVNNSSLSEKNKFSKDFASRFLVIKDKALKFDDASNQLLSSISSGYDLASLLNLEDVIYKGGTLEVAVIEPLGDLGPSIPIRIKLPQFATEKIDSLLSWLSNTLQSVMGDLWGGKIWR